MGNQKKNKPLISVCCLTYNQENFAKEAIESIWMQKYPEIEIIVIDDGSRDETYKLLKSLVKKSPYPMSVETQKNTGKIGFNLNRALKKAKGEYITFLSLDDKYIPGSIDKLINIALTDPSIIFVCPDRTIEINGSGEEIGIIKSPMYGMTEKDIKIEKLFQLEMMLGVTFYIQSAIFKKSIIDEVGGFDDDLIGDDIVLRVKIEKYMIENKIGSYVIVPFPTFYYRQHDTNIHNNKERQIQIIWEVAQRYNNGYAPILRDWILSTSVYYLKKGILMFFDSRISRIDAFFYYVRKFFIFICKKIIGKIRK